MQEENKMKPDEKQRIGIAGGVCAVLMVILLPVLCANLTLVLRGYFLGEKVPMLFGIAPMIVLSDSMVPELYSGDLIFCKRAEIDEVDIGDVISFFDPDGNDGQIITHRICGITETDGVRMLQTRGDANNSPDLPSVAEKQLIGVLVYRLKGLGRTALFFQSAPGIIIISAVPLICLLWFRLRRATAERSKMRG